MWWQRILTYLSKCVEEQYSKETLTMIIFKNNDDDDDFWELDDKEAAYEDVDSDDNHNGDASKSTSKFIEKQILQ